MSVDAPVLVTGVTGFIGREAARRLLAAGRRVIALARARDRASARERVARTVGLEPDGERLVVLEGDLALPDLGLACRDGERLTASVETVIHSAGDTMFFPESPAAFHAVHVTGPVALLRLLARGRLRRWAQLSTAYVAGRRAGAVLEREGDVGQSFRNPYERVKLEAEDAVKAAGAAAGVDVRIFRPSIVVGSAPGTPGGIPSGLFFAFIRLVAALAEAAGPQRVALRITASAGAPFNIVPVEHVAAAAVGLAEHPAGSRGTFHLVAADPPSQAEVLAAITERLGVRGLSLVGAIARPTVLERRVERMLAAYREYLQHEVRFEDTEARRALAALGMAPPVLDREALHALIDRALLDSSALLVPLMP
jgi:thioester reductase-like protein